MLQSPQTDESLRAELAELRARLDEAQEALRAITAGEVDALVVQGAGGPRLFTLEGHDAEQNRRRGEMLAQVSDAVIAVDLDQRVIYLNAATERQYGVTASATLGQPLTEIYDNRWLHPEDEAAARTALREGGTWREQSVHLTREGRTLPVELTVSVLRGPDGSAIGAIAAIRDISERKQAEEEKSEALRLVDALLTHAPVGFAYFDRELRYERINEQLAAVNGIPAEAHIGRTVAEVVPTLAPAVREVTERILATGQPVCDHEFSGETALAPGVTRQWNESWYPVRDRSGAIIGFGAVVEEITARKQAEEALTRLAAIVGSSNDALFSEDLDGIVTSWNRGAEEIFGYRADEIVGTSIMRLIPEALQAEEHERQRELAAGAQGGTFETIRQTKDGRQFPASITISPLRDAAGHVIGTSRVVRDITDQKRVETALRENAALFSTLIAQAPMGTYVVDAQFRLWQVNAEAMPVFASVEPLIGRDFREAISIVWGRDLGAQIADIFRHTLETGERYVSPPFTEQRHDLGIDQSYEWQTQRVTLPDGQHGVVCYFHEVTERAQAVAALRTGAERLRLAAEATGIGVWEWHLRTNRIRWDAQMFRLYGIAPTVDGYVTYDDWRGAVVPEELAANEAVLQETVRRSGRSRRMFQISRRSDGARRHIEAVEVVRTNAAGGAEWVLGTNLDVTARQQAEDELRSLAAALAQADRRKDAFLATLSHELRNPLAAIRTGIHLSRLASDDQVQVQRNWERMERQVGTLVRLLDDLLDVSRISQDKLTLQRQRLNVAAIIHRAVETSQPMLDARRHAITVTLPPQPIELDGDETRLVQVVSNLLTNAAKYSDLGNPIWLTVEAAGDVAEIRVRDRGIGIAAADLPRLFEMFGQVDGAKERSQGGLGIGLHLVKRLVEMHGGSVEARSDGLGHGSEFVVRLPIAPTVATQPGAEHHSASSRQTHRLRILVADDNEDAAATLADLMTQLGHEAHIAQNGVEAVALAETLTPDVALLDIGMPGLGGDEAARQIRALPGAAGMKLIAVTGWGQDEDRARSRAAGFDHHLVKPVDPAALATLLDSFTSASPSNGVPSSVAHGDA